MKKRIILTFAIISSPLIGADAPNLPSQDYPKAPVLRASIKGGHIVFDKRTDALETFTVKGTILPGTTITKIKDDSNLFDIKDELFLETCVTEDQPIPNYVVSFPEGTRLILDISSGAQVRIASVTNVPIGAVIHNAAKLHVNKLKGAILTVRDGGNLEVDEGSGMQLTLNIYGGKATFNTASYDHIRLYKFPYEKIPENATSFPSVFINSGKIDRLEGSIEPSAIDYKNAHPIALIRASVNKADLEITSHDVVQQFDFEGAKKFTVITKQKGKGAKSIQVLQYDPTH
jgi:hypothetical protein